VQEDIGFLKDLLVLLAIGGMSGWLFQKMGLSTVVGCLMAGVLLGPHNNPWGLVEDTARVESLSQIGLLFLMFSIGLGFSIRKLRRLGLSLIFANLIAAAFLFNALRAVGHLLGWSEQASVFLAAMFMIGSSAIISKILAETGCAHEKPAQQGMGLLIVEDALVVIILTLLASYIQEGSMSIRALGKSTLFMAIFIGLLLVVGLVLVPKTLVFMRREMDGDLLAPLACSLVFGFAFLSHEAGYPVALGAFLLGAIISDTPAKSQIERHLSGMIHVLESLFFVSIGMLIEWRAVVGHLGLIFLLAAVVLTLRSFGYTLGLLAIGNRIQESVRSGLMVAPIGEFSFIIALMGVRSKMAPDGLEAVAVGVCLLTAISGPFLVRRSNWIGLQAAEHMPGPLRNLIHLHRSWLGMARHWQDTNVLWKLSKRRVLQIIREWVVVSGILIFCQPVYDEVERFAGRDILFHGGTPYLLGMLVMLLLAAPLMAMWRNTSALLMIYAEASSAHPAVRHLVQAAGKFALFVALLVWSSILLPFHEIGRWLLLSLAGFLAFALVFLRKKLILWHSRFEIALHESVSTQNATPDQKLPQLVDSYQNWNLEVLQCLLPDQSLHAGCALQDLNIRRQFGATVVAIERQGHLIRLPPASTQLYPHDKVLIMAPPVEARQAREFLSLKEREANHGRIDEMTLEETNVPPASPLAGKTLGELELGKRHGLQIVALQRGRERLADLSGQEALRPGDNILLLGERRQIQNFLRELASPNPPAA
jgi:CPA2 family monovalent cation:H+ antiporter-2